MLKNGADILVADVEDDNVRITKIQMKKPKIKKVWIKSKNETISIDKNEICIISYVNLAESVVSNVNIKAGLYQ